MKKPFNDTYRSSNATLLVSALLAVMVSIGCSDQKSSSSRGNAKADVEASRGEVERAVRDAMSSGKSDAEALRAGEAALDRSMARKGYKP